MPLEILARAVLLDMDGTLVDSAEAIDRLWHRFAERVGIDPGELLATHHGIPMRDTVERHAPDGTDIDEVITWLSALEIAELEGQRPVPGAPELLAALPEDRVALVTSGSRALAESRMAAAGLQLPRVAVTSGETRGKPSPEPYLRAAELLGVPADQTVVFEDADAGVRAGLAAGARVVVVGDLASTSTTGLARIPDLVRIEVEALQDGVRLTLPVD